MGELLNLALVDVLKCTKQNWPSTRTPLLQPVEDASIPIPASENRIRVQGKDAELFGDAAIRDMTSVMNIAEVYGFTDGVVLDWGVGCGRMIRHMPKSVQDRCLGCDIDSVNIAWCQDNMSFGKYSLLQPFGGFDAVEPKSVDLLYSFSVMTHLGEDAQFHWLREIGKILRGIAIVSVHGLYDTAKYANWLRDCFETQKWLLTGFKDSGKNNPDIADVAPDMYYRDVAHTPKYVYGTWNNYVEVLDIIPGAFGEHDAVVLKSRS